EKKLPGQNKESVTSKRASEVIRIRQFASPIENSITTVVANGCVVGVSECGRGRRIEILNRSAVDIRQKLTVGSKIGTARKIAGLRLNARAPQVLDVSINGMI